MPNRNLKDEGHKYFDILWLYRLHHSGKSVGYWRRKLYTWLAKEMDIPKKDCHFSLMTDHQIKKAIDICSEQFANNEKLLIFVDRLENGQYPEYGWFVRKYLQNG